MPAGMGGGGMQGMMGSMGGGAKKQGNKPRPEVKDFQPKDDDSSKGQKKYHPNVLRAREPISNFQPASPSSFHKGGRVKKGGVAKVKKDEEVLTPRDAKEYRKMKRVAGNKPKTMVRKGRKNKKASAKRAVVK
jgi:hypothetical protein